MVKTYHMRRGDNEIKDRKKLARILNETNFVTLALANENEPYVVSLSHSYDEEAGCLYFHCANEGKKLEYMRGNPVVSGQALIDHGYHAGQCSHLYVSAVFKGKIEFIEDIDRKKRALEHMILHQEKNPDALLTKLKAYETGSPLDKTIVGRIVIDELTGKKSAEVAF
ncbi:MAG: pyridoxamine 5'-phosphate oxidase family protein [Candidatus Bathyarchaeia archaeon]|jgi:nitroimidazol reductase NimA-like FMN-containing flavoprotein (pyridoxamine 5'-phosphate oxidase superfamily)